MRNRIETNSVAVGEAVSAELSDIRARLHRAGVAVRRVRLGSAVGIALAAAERYVTRAKAALDTGEVR